MFSKLGHTWLIQASLKTSIFSWATLLLGLAARIRAALMTWNKKKKIFFTIVEHLEFFLHFEARPSIFCSLNRISIHSTWHLNFIGFWSGKFQSNSLMSYESLIRRKHFLNWELNEKKSLSLTNSKQKKKLKIYIILVDRNLHPFVSGFLVKWV